jgi:multiple sugar transport system permease protein
VESSIVIALGSAALSLLIGVPAGYALARSRSRRAVLVAYFFLAIRTVPPIATLLPFYLLMRDIGLLGTWWSVILLNTTLNAAFVVWMMFSYFRSLPRELEEAALTDGCTLPGGFFRVALPLVVPGIIASALLCIMFSWNDFLYSSFLTRAETKPISVALLVAYSTKDITWGTLGALAHFSTVPIVLIALALNRYFVQGMTRGIS